MELALGGLWLVDGALQFQPIMFTKGFLPSILGMANMGLPGPLSRLDFRVASLLTAHVVAGNALFASLQVAIGVGLVWGRERVRTWARGASILWALSVWIIGEGVGAMFMGGTSLLTGAPGAALIYAIVAVVIWPPRLRAGWAQAAWAALWVGGALFELQSVNHAAGVPGAQIVNGAVGEPGWVGAFDRTVGHALAGGGGLFAVGLGAAAVFAGLGVLVPATRKAALVTGVATALFVGLVGQDLGGVLTGQGTDPGSGPLFVLLGIAAWPGPLLGWRTVRTTGEEGRLAAAPSGAARAPVPAGQQG